MKNNVVNVAEYKYIKPESNPIILIPQSPTTKYRPYSEYYFGN